MTEQFKLKLQHSETGRTLDLAPNDRGAINVPAGSWFVVIGQTIPQDVSIQGVTSLGEILESLGTNPRTLYD